MRLGARTRALAAFISLGAAVAQATPLISEFMASNNTTITDQDGDFADWLEVYNPDATPANLGGWFLTNKAATPEKWQIPAVILPPGGYLVIFCSEKNYTDPSQPLATNFNLSASGGYLALEEPDGKTVASSYTFPVQYPDVSYGVSQPTGTSEPVQTGYLMTPTPGATNGNHLNILLSDSVTLSTPAGIFTGSTAVTLSGAAAGEHIRYVLVPPSASGDQGPAPTASSPEYSGTLTISSTALLKAAVFSADDSQRGLPAAAMYLQLDNSTANRLDTFSSNLPLVVFDDNGFGLLPNNHVFYPAWIGAFSLPAEGGSSLVEAPDFFSSDMMKLHGFSSAGFPKQSYESALSDDLGRSRVEPFFGLASDKSWDNISAWTIDRTYVHNGFVYSLARSMGYWAPGTKYSEMFIHSSGGPLDLTSYSGVTCITERLKVGANRINIFALSPSDVAVPNVTGGYVLRFDHPEMPSGAYTYYTWTTDLGSTLMLDTPKADVLVQPQIDYITGYVQEMENAMAGDLASGYATRSYLNYLDRPSWVDYHLLNVFVENVDAFHFSEYFTKDVNGLIRAGPVWDYDRSMGSADGRDVNPQQWTANKVEDYWNDGWWAYLTHDPDFMQLWVDRWQSLRLTLLSSNSLKALVNSQAAQIGPQAAARDAARWPDNLSRFGGAWSGEIDNMISWLTTRAAWIDQQFVPPPAVQLTGSSRTLIPAGSAAIVYTLDGSDPRVAGGALSPSAQVASSPVTLPAAQAYAARSYQASMAGIYPGSPWSSPVGGQGRLTNVSGRSVAGSGGEVLIEGFVISGPPDSQEQVLLRADGPVLAQFGLAVGFLAQPSLSVYDSSGNLVASNTNWGTAPNAPAIANAAAVAGAFALPSGSADCALLLNLAPGAYTMQISGANGTAGVALGEVYEIGSSGSSVINLSSRGLVSAGGALINGLAISGTAPQPVLLRGDGPALAAFGVANALAAPLLQLFDAKGNLVASNTGWGRNANATQIAAAAAAVGAFALQPGSADSALLLTLQPGNYTVVITGADGGSGAALAETYAVPQT